MSKPEIRCPGCGWKGLKDDVEHCQEIDAEGMRDIRVCPLCDKNRNFLIKLEDLA